MSTCIYCSCPISTDAQFCQRCGRQQIQQHPSPLQAQPQTKPAGKLKRLGQAIIVLWGLMILIGAIISSLTPSHDIEKNELASVSATPSPISSPTPYPAISYLQTVKSNWKKGGFGSIAIWNVTLKNVSTDPIGNIRYKVRYYSETGGLVGTGEGDGVLLPGQVIERVIPPKSTRTIRINDGFVNSQAHTADFTVVGCEFVTDNR